MGRDWDGGGAIGPWLFDSDGTVVLSVTGERTVFAVGGFDTVELCHVREVSSLESDSRGSRFLDDWSPSVKLSMA